MLLSAAMRDELLNWFRKYKRDLPWRHDREPYHVWLSEIMCQQTRVEAVKRYYLRFLKALPDIASLAECDEEQLLKLWEGLGYYSRVRNLQRAAIRVMSEYGGCFPSEYETIRSLPGIGDYTAAAIASICFCQPKPVVDGNVLRVWARFCGDESDIRLPDTKTRVRDSLLPLFEGVDSGELNQAFMELGALVCRPNGEPDCEICPLREGCVSRPGMDWRHLPFKSPARPRREERMTVLLLRCDDRIALQKRPKRGLLAGLWELPHASGTLSPQEALDFSKSLGCQPLNVLASSDKEHIFTHITWKMRAYEIDCGEMPETLSWPTESEIREAYSLPTAFRQFLEP